MSLGETNNLGPILQHQENIKIEPVDVDHDQFDGSLLISKLKCENEEDDSNWDQSCELNNMENTLSFSACFIKQEPEDDSDDFDNNVYQMQAESVKLNKEELYTEEREPAGRELNGRSGNVEIYMEKGCDTVQENELQSSESKSEEEANVSCAYCPDKINNGSSSMAFYNRTQEQCTQVYECNECPYKSENKCYLVRHSKQKHSGRAQVYKCEECSYETQIKGNLTKHYKYKHAKEAVSYKCYECSFETRYKSDLTKHFKCKHATDAEVYKCQECSFETRIKTFFNGHYKYKHSKEAEVFKCEECAYETIYKYALTRHYKCTHSKEVYKCGECSFETKVKQYLTSHYKRKHNEGVKV